MVEYQIRPPLRPQSRAAVGELGSGHFSSGSPVVVTALLRTGRVEVDIHPKDAELELDGRSRAIPAGW